MVHWNGSTEVGKKEEEEKGDFVLMMMIVKRKERRKHSGIEIYSFQEKTCWKLFPKREKSLRKKTRCGNLKALKKCNMMALNQCKAWQAANVSQTKTKDVDPLTSDVKLKCWPCKRKRLTNRKTEWKNWIKKLESLKLWRAHTTWWNALRKLQEQVEYSTNN